MFSIRTGLRGEMSILNACRKLSLFKNPETGGQRSDININPIASNRISAACEYTDEFLDQSCSRYGRVHLYQFDLTSRDAAISGTDLLPHLNYK
jgi:hypothetical protein